jgi:hypothetical protein
MFLIHFEFELRKYEIIDKTNGLVIWQRIWNNHFRLPIADPALKLRYYCLPAKEGNFHENLSGVHKLPYLIHADAGFFPVCKKYSGNNPAKSKGFIRNPVLIVRL